MENFFDDYDYIDHDHPEDPNRTLFGDLSSKLKAAITNPKRKKIGSDLGFITDKELRFIKSSLQDEYFPKKTDAT